MSDVDSREVTPDPEIIGRGELTDVPECDRHDCDDNGPFMVRTQAGPVNRCRNCLRKDLAADWWQFVEARA